MILPTASRRFITTASAEIRKPASTEVVDCLELASVTTFEGVTRLIRRLFPSDAETHPFLELHHRVSGHAGRHDIKPRFAANGHGVKKAVHERGAGEQELRRGHPNQAQPNPTI